MIGSSPVVGLDLRGQMSRVYGCFGGKGRGTRRVNAGECGFVAKEQPCNLWFADTTAFAALLR